MDEKQLTQPQIATSFCDEAGSPVTFQTIRSQHNGRKNKQDRRNEKETIAKRAAHARTAVEANGPQDRHPSQLADQQPPRPRR